jgi:hypothetical protein
MSPKARKLLAKLQWASATGKTLVAARLIRQLASMGVRLQVKS